jgi:hypothetical protein
MTKKGRKTLFIGAGIFFVLAASIVLLYSLGYKLDKSLNFFRRGGLYIIAPQTGTDIYLDFKKKKTTSRFNTKLFLSLRPKTYSVMTAKEGFWPWEKKLKVKAGTVTEAKSFMLPRETKGKVLLKGNYTDVWPIKKDELLVLNEEKNNKFELDFYLPKEDAFLKKETQSARLLVSTGKVKILSITGDELVFEGSGGIIKAAVDPSKKTITASRYVLTKQEIQKEENPVFNLVKYNKSKDVKIWWDPKTRGVMLDWLGDENVVPYYICPPEIPSECRFPLELFQAYPTVRNIDFFPSRDDLIIFAAGNGIYAREIDGRGDGRLLQPIYKGKSPTFSVLNNKNSIYVLDDGVLMEVYLK